MAGLFDRVLGARAAAGDRPGLLRRRRLHDARFTIDAPDELGLVLTLSETHRVVRRRGTRTEDTPPRFGSITLLPPGDVSHFAVSGPARVLMARLPWPTLTAWLAEDHGVDAARLELAPRLHAGDPALARALFAWAAGEADGLAHAAAGRALATALLRGHATAPQRGAMARAGLAPARLRRVLERVEAELAAPLGLVDLAREAGVSPYHFAREFRRSVGESVHGYVLGRRVARAVQLLSDRERSVAAVAKASGFAQASHFARHLRRATGLTPTGLRAILP